MTNKLHLVQKTVFLTCNWVPTGNPRMPLACIWTGPRTAQAASTASSTGETGGMHLCA
jgi:hypothetical protein